MQCTGVGKLTSPNYSSLASKWKERQDELKLAERYTAGPDFGSFVRIGRGRSRISADINTASMGTKTHNSIPEQIKINENLKSETLKF